MNELELVKQFQTLEEVTRWALSCKPPKLFSDASIASDKQNFKSKSPGFDIVIQDEYSHDIVVPYSENVYLVYDTT